MIRWPCLPRATDSDCRNQPRARLDCIAPRPLGLLVQLPQWQFPIVIDTASGNVKLDNFQGCWGDQRELEKFMQAYAVEKAKIEARRKGYSVSETALQDGSIKVQLTEGGT